MTEHIKIVSRGLFVGSLVLLTISGTGYCCVSDIQYEPPTSDRDHAASTINCFFTQQIQEILINLLAEGF